VGWSIPKGSRPVMKCIIIICRGGQESFGQDSMKQKILATKVDSLKKKKCNTSNVQVRTQSSKWWPLLTEWAGRTQYKANTKYHGSRKAVAIALLYQWSFCLWRGGAGSPWAKIRNNFLSSIQSAKVSIAHLRTRMSVLGQGPQIIIYYLHNLQLGNR